MSTISNASKSASANVIDKSLFADSKERSSLKQEDFMKLFVTELRHQDPMEPMDTGQMASQIAQINQVDLMYKNNIMMEKMLAASQEQVKIQAVEYIGQNVRYEGNYAMVQDGRVKPFDIELMDNAKSVKISIFNKNGSLIQEISKGPMLAGKNALEWDGLDKNRQAVPDGDYRVVVEATDEKGKYIETKNWTTGVVNGVSYNKGATKLILKNGAELALEDIWKIGY